MAIDSCDVCSCVQANFSSKEAFRLSVGRALCAIIDGLGGGAMAGDDVEFLVLCDDQGGGTVVQFFRRIITDSVGTPTVADYELDGSTPYVPSGTVQPCTENIIDREVLLLCDDQGGGTIVEFLRHISVDVNGVVGISDTELDGTTPYVPSGTVESCTSQSTLNNQAIVLLDDNGATSTAFIRQIQIDSDGNVSIVDTELDGTTPYVPTGTVKVGDVPPTQQALVLLDDNGATSTAFIRHIRIDAEGTVSVTDTELDGTTVYAVTGTVKAGDVPPTHAVVELYDNNAGVLTEFLRHIRIDSEGTVSVSDTELDGTTAYVVTGTEQLKTTHTTEDSTVTTTSTGGSSSTSAGNYRTEFKNVGLTAATVDGVSLPAGSSLLYESYVDPVSKILKTVPDIAYDAGTSTLLIVEIAP